MNSQSNETFTKFLAFAIPISIFHVFFQAFAFNSQLRPDEYKALETFAEFFFATDSLTTESEFALRLFLTSINLVVLFILRKLNLIDIQTVILTFVWPFSWFLMGKIYWEWFVFPFMLIRIDLPRPIEFCVIAFLTLLLVLTGESNLILLIAFRILLFMRGKLRVLACATMVLAAVVIDLSFSADFVGSIPFFGEHLIRFDWTRSVANPEYSILETAAVFISSIHFFTLHNLLWGIDMAFSLVLIAIIAFDRESRRNAMEQRLALLTFISVLLSASFITHCFQNARYYFFYIPVLSQIFKPRQIVALGLLGVLHVLIKSIEVFLI